ncbi:PRC-barrel domain-containing protein [Marinovum sp.]|uniref:PRC-barrel domain-containing protein n=1 Tax=Marinovum sp. TaxID=2024839 RepID=UPI002B26FFE4|nr:PRC-barrel domain-containing protein [Marinovum sp.]
MTRLTLLALTTALVAGPAFAESHVQATDGTAMENTEVATDMDHNDTMMNDELDYAQLIRSRDITGGAIYTMNEAMDEGSWGEYEAEGVGTDWNEIGEIEDIVLDRSGQMVGVVAEIGGFLDIGDKHVLIRMQDVRLTAVDDESYALVTRKSEEELEAMEGVDEGWWD